MRKLKKGDRVAIPKELLFKKTKEPYLVYTVVEDETDLGNFIVRIDNHTYQGHNTNKKGIKLI